MAKVIKVHPRDFIITMEIPLTNVRELKAILAKCSMSPKTELEEAGANYLEQVFEPLLSERVEEYE